MTIREVVKKWRPERKKAKAQGGGEMKLKKSHCWKFSSCETCENRNRYIKYYEVTKP